MKRSTRLPILAVLAAACAESPTDPAPQVAPDQSVSTCADVATSRDPLRFAAAYPCGEAIQMWLTGATGTEPDAIRTGAYRLNESISATQFGLPYFAASQGDHSVYVTVDANHYTSGTPYYYCGHKTGTYTLKIYRLGPNDACPPNTGANPVRTTNLTALAAHELAHVYGWEHFTATVEPQFNPCVMNISGSTIYSSYCTLEKQLIYYEYGLRNTDPTTTRPLSNSVSVSLSSGTATIQPGETRTLKATVYGCAGASTANSVAISYSVSSSSTCLEDVDWTVSNSAALQILSQNDTMAVIKALTPTSTTTATVTAHLRVTPTTVWPEQTGSYQLTVNAPPPQVPNVGSITLSPNPVTTVAGGVQVTATVRDPQGNVMTNVPLAWSTRNQAVATVWGGHVCGVSEGATRVTATAENGVRGGADVYVPKTGTGCW